ncbi:MAG TPA: uracil-DNA glycosylase [Candidatus Methylacidiphilales bacterium]|nr:uracil-DNA glycosylase [Candidatus Methylacidiphilales bacterium]
MTETIRGYVHFMREREGVRQIRLTRAAREGLAKLVSARATHSPVARATSLPGSSRASGTTGSEAPSVNRPLSAPVARSATATQAPTRPISINERIEVTGSTKAEQLAHLNERAQACQKCPHLVARRHTVVFGVGDPEAQLMFVGEGPGEEEDLKGEPFVGKAGQLLTKMIAAMGLTREQVYIGNIVKCRPDMPPGVPGNRKPTREEMDTCVPYLRAQIDIIKPRALVALGATAIEGLVGATGSMGSLRGKFLEYRGVPVMPTYHPSYLLRNQSNTEKRKVWEDLLKVMEKLELPISEKQRGYFLAK